MVLVLRDGHRFSLLKCFQINLRVLQRSRTGPGLGVWWVGDVGEGVERMGVVLHMFEQQACRSKLSGAKFG